MNIFGIGLPEMAVIAAIGLLVFGPKRLPELGKTLGRTLKGFQSASSEFEKEFRSAIATIDTPSADTPSVDSALPHSASSHAASLESPAVGLPAAKAEQPLSDGPAS
jgi:sec-independent protein translocase protein TatA